MSTQIRFRKTPLAVAMMAAFASGGAIADPPGTPDYVVADAQATDWLYVGANSSNNTLNNTATNLTSNPTPYYNQSATNGTPPTPNTGYTTFYDPFLQTFQRQNVTSPGSVLSQNGNLTISGSTVYTRERTYYDAYNWVRNPDNSNTTLNNVQGYVSPSTNPADLRPYNFTIADPNALWNTTSPVAYTGGGNLTMDGTATVKNGIIVSTRSGTSSGAENSGRGRLVVDGLNAQIGVINDSGYTNGLTANTNGTSILGGSGSAQARVDLHGTNASLTNSNDKGVHVYADRTVLSGGAASTYLTMGSSTATFSSNANGTGPIRVTGIADGVNQYDAVNYGQVASAYSSLRSDIKDVENKAYGGIASAVALAGIPAPAAGKQFTVGAGYGYYEGESAFALGGRAQVTPEFQLTAGWGYSSEGNAFNVGAGYSW